MRECKLYLPLKTFKSLVAVRRCTFSGVYRLAVQFSRKKAFATRFGWVIVSENQSNGYGVCLYIRTDADTEQANLPMLGSSSFYFFSDYLTFVTHAFSYLRPDLASQGTNFVLRSILLWFLNFSMVTFLAIFRVVPRLDCVSWNMRVNLKATDRVAFLLSFYASICLRGSSWLFLDIVRSFTRANDLLGFHDDVWFVPAILSLVTQPTTWLSFPVAEQLSVGVLAICKQVSPRTPAL